jgi:diguanylate cyclase (GGDEF)-like protein
MGFVRLKISMKKFRYKSTLMQLQVSLQKKVLFTAAIMFVLILIVMGFHVPNPNMILIMGLVFCSAVFGFGGGIIAAVIMLGYTLYFFSTGHSFIHYTDQNMQKVLVSLLGIVVDMLLICQLKAAEVESFNEVKTLSRQLELENQELQRMSLTDALTGIRNRLALRLAYDAYINKQVVVILLDLNGFKAINDTKGHSEGDRVLAETGRLLAGAFGGDRCYRYGGDEFLVIHPDMSENELLSKMDSVAQAAPSVEGFGRVTFSYGCSHGMLSDPDVLRTLIMAADKKMYEVKRSRCAARRPSGSGA